MSELKVFALPAIEIIPKRHALLSVKPCYAEAILSGRKMWEFRRVVPTHRDGLVCVLYASSPVRRIVGAFYSSYTENGTVSEVWAATHGLRGVTEENYRHYFEGTDTASAMLVSGVHRVEPMVLGAISDNESPPQSFRYLSLVERVRFYGHLFNCGAQALNILTGAIVNPLTEPEEVLA
jgi:predicted transcriptional regulator